MVGVPEGAGGVDGLLCFSIDLENSQVSCYLCVVLSFLDGNHELALQLHLETDGRHASSNVNVPGPRERGLLVFASGSDILLCSAQRDIGPLALQFPRHDRLVLAVTSKWVGLGQLLSVLPML